ncbi:DsbA family oxidoreductase [Isoptericola halotolerans]|uniref:DsbA family dithiol-disulfide isomerase n=1 Tax=Isoptericola halotolerans TaxID=300560 RepID=A0ABX2A4Q8_9MICO|nr:putative DsbA family dithiol-disulfide isomerase [Isoptericola halotolerans]
MTSLDTRLQIEVWSDVLCPWCYIGDARLEAAIKDSPQADRIDIRIRTFQLDPEFPAVPTPVVDYLAAKKGLPVEQAEQMEAQVAELARAEGLAYEPNHLVQNTLDMLRLVHLGNDHGVGWQYMTAMQTALFSGDPEAFVPETLVRLGADLGIPEAEVRDVLASDRYADAVRAEHEEAIALGARGVPFTVLGRRLGIPGAVPVESYRQAIDQAWEHVDA